MADPVVKIKRSSVPGKTPTTEQLTAGEFAINTYDGKIFIEQDQGGVGVGTTVITVNPWNVGLGSTAYNTYFTAGNVGVGTTNPTSKLHIIGDARIVGTVTATAFVGDGSGLTNISASGSGVAISTNTTNSNQYLTYATGFGTVSGLGATNSLVFNPSTGYLGIGTTNPTKPLHIYTSDGDIKIGDITEGTPPVDAGIVFTGLGSNTSGLFTEVNGTILSYGINAQQLLTTSGIETARSGGVFRLDTRNSGLFGSSNCFVVKGRSAGTTTEHDSIVIDLNDGNTYLSPSKGSVIVATSSSTGTASQTLQVAGGAYVSGSIGIGTTNPSVKLQVGGVIGFNDTNVRIGDANVGNNLTSGIYNNFIGGSAGCNNTSGCYNNFFGIRSGFSNNIGSGNNFLGNQAGFANTGGSFNNFFGNNAGYASSTGCYNNFFGFNSGYSNLCGSNNNFFGNQAGFANTTGNHNNFFGLNAGYSNGSGDCNNFFGYNAGRSNSSGRDNNFLGTLSGCTNTTGCFNNFFGIDAGRYNSSGSYNNFLGYLSGRTNTTGNHNIFFGSNSGYANCIGTNNIIMGQSAGFSNDTGNCNVFIGFYAGRQNQSGSSNVIIGAGRTATPILNGSNQLVIGSGSNDWIVGDSSYNVGIGTTNPLYKLHVVGSFGATTKSFSIPHPTKKGKTLQYGSLESPYHGVRLTGKGTIENGKSIIELPDYISAFVKEEEINIQVTNIRHGEVLWVENVDVENNNFTIQTKKTRGTYEFYWDFTAIRKDVADLVVEV